MKRLTILCYKNGRDLNDLNVNHILNGHAENVGKRFVSIVKKHMANGKNVAIASYSDTVINMTGHLIAKGVLNSSQVRWIICDRDLMIDGKLRKGEFNSDGRIIAGDQWVYGYFIPSDDIIKNTFNK